MSVVAAAADVLCTGVYGPGSDAVASVMLKSDLNLAALLRSSIFQWWVPHGALFTSLELIALHEPGELNEVGQS